MNLDGYNNDLIEAAKELDREFPGAAYDDSLREYLEHRRLKKLGRKKRKALIGKIVFHAFFYAVFTAFFSFLTREHGIGLAGNMMWAVSYFAFYYLIKDFLPVRKQNEHQQ